LSSLVSPLPPSFSLLPRPPPSTLFPYTTLFRSTSTHSHFHTLCRLRDELGIDVSVNFSSLAEFLREQSWEPGLDLMRKLGESNGWVKQLYEKRASKSNLISGLSVFVLRNWEIGRAHV